MLNIVKVRSVLLISGTAAAAAGSAHATVAALAASITATEPATVAAPAALATATALIARAVDSIFNAQVKA